MRGADHAFYTMTSMNLALELNARVQEEVTVDLDKKIRARVGSSG
jgi:hypothetical protein